MAYFLYVWKLMDASVGIEALSWQLTGARNFKMIALAFTGEMAQCKARPSQTY